MSLRDSRVYDKVSPPICLIIQHVEPEGPYAIADGLRAAGVEADIRQTFAGSDPLPDSAGFDGLVVMGGPMSASSNDGFPTRRAELDLIADALRSGIPILGVCLGAQLLALAGGGLVFPGQAGPEVGWAPVDLTGAAEGDPLLTGLPSQLTVLHWHGDTFELPPMAVELAWSSLYKRQAFRIGVRAWGFQFHLEVDEDAVAAFLREFPSDAVKAGTTPEEIDAQSSAVLKELGPERDLILDRFATLVATRQREQPKLTR